MKDIPSGNAAISIAHPSHELRIHGFISRVKPFGFIMTDGSGMESTSSMFNFQNYFKNIHRGNEDAFVLIMNGNKFITEENIYTELLAKRHSFFDGYTRLMTHNLIRKKIDYIVADSSEEYSVSHEMCRITTDLAVRYVKKTTGKEIMNYDFAIMENIRSNTDERCIHIKLTEKEFNDKAMYFAGYHPCAFYELKKNMPLDLKIIEKLQQTEGGIEEIKKILLSLNKDFFYNEFIRPRTSNIPIHNLCYQTERFLERGLLDEPITYQEHIKPIKEKIESALGLT